MNLQQEMEYYMQLPYKYNIEKTKTAKGETHYIGYISELGIKASGKTEKDVTTNLTLVKRDYILNKLTNHKNIPQPEDVDSDFNKKFDEAWNNNNSVEVKKRVKTQEALTKNKAVGTVNLSKLVPKEEPKPEPVTTHKPKTYNPISKMLNWLYSKFSDEGDKRDDERQ